MGSQILIITGMHRSGTSLVASLLQQSGIQIGSRLVPPGRANPHGFFEDADFVDFHRTALRERGLTHIVSEEFRFEPTLDEVSRAKALIQERSQESKWGWKDPRTTLFLDFWYQLLPQASFLFLYRHPLEVLLSLIRRGDPHVAGIVEGLQAWCIYNTRIIDFFKRYSRQCVLCHIYSLIDQTEMFNDLVTQKFELDAKISKETLDALYNRADLRRLTQSVDIDSALSRIFPYAAQVYRQLENIADLHSMLDESRVARLSVFSALETILGALQEPQRDPYNRGALLLLLTFLDQEAVKSFYDQYRKSIAETEHASVWLEGQLANWQAEARRQAAIVAELQSGFAELERGKGWLEKEWRKWQAEAECQAAIVAEQQTWIAELEKRKAWLEAERAKWQADAE